MTRHPLDQVIHIGLHRFAVPGMVELAGMAAQEILFLYQGDVVALVGQAQGGLHTGHAAADNQTGLGDRQIEFLQRRLQAHSGHGHADLVLGPMGGGFRLVLVNPGALIPDVGHLKEVLVEAGFLDGLLEGGFMGARRAGGHHHAVEVVLLDPFLDESLGVLGAGKQAVLHEGDMGQGAGVVPHRLHIDHAGDIDAAAADEDADPGLFGGHIPLGEHRLFLGQGVTGLGEHLAGRGGGGGGFHHRLGDVLGALEGAADKNSGLAGGHRRKGGRIGELVRVERHPQGLAQCHHFGGHFHAHREDHQFKDLVF